MTGGFRRIEHTADVGLEAWGPDLEELFRQAARALFDVAVELDRIDPRERHEIRLEADAADLLLRDWLSELLYLFSSKGFVFSRFEFSRLTETALEAAAFGEPFSEERHELKTEIKAVTYHDLAVERDQEGWRARVVLDL